MIDTRPKAYLAKVRGKENEARWSDIPYLISIPGRPELSLFPDMLTWHLGNSQVEQPYVRSVSYFPRLLSLRRLPSGAEFEMNYHSIHDPGFWISFRATVDRSRWKADKFQHGKNVGTVVGQPGGAFYLNLALLPINEGENHFVRDWPSEEMAATLSRISGVPPAQKEPTPKPDFPTLCLSLLEYTRRSFGLSYERAAWMLIEIFRCEMPIEAPGSTRPN